MKVNDLQAYLSSEAVGAKRAERGERGERVPERERERSSVSREDRVELAGSRLMERVRTRAREIPEVREERVEALRREIEAGTYQVAPQEVARAMLSDLLKDLY